MREKRSFNKRNNYVFVFHHHSPYIDRNTTKTTTTTTQLKSERIERIEKMKKKYAVARCTFTAKCDDKLCISNVMHLNLRFSACNGWLIIFNEFWGVWTDVVYVCEIAWKIVPSSRSCTILAAMCMSVVGVFFVVVVFVCISILFLCMVPNAFLCFSIGFRAKSVTHKQIRIISKCVRDIIFFCLSLPLSEW